MNNITVFVLTTLASICAQVAIGADAPPSQPTGGSTPTMAERFTVSARGGMDMSLTSFWPADDARAMSGAQFQGSLRPGFTTRLETDVMIIKYLTVGLEIGYQTVGYQSETLTMMDTNLTNPSENLYVDPFDLAEKRGGIGGVWHDAFTLGIIVKGQIPIAIGKVLTMTPFAGVGFETDFVLSSYYQVKSGVTFNYKPFSQDVKLYLPLAMGVDLGTPIGHFIFDARFCANILRTEERIIQSFVAHDYPMDITVPAHLIHQIQFSLGYGINFGMFAKKAATSRDLNH